MLVNHLIMVIISKITVLNVNLYNDISDRLNCTIERKEPYSSA